VIRDGKNSGAHGWSAWLLSGFITSYGLLHLEPEDSRLVWTDEREIAGARIGIVGLNSAWSCVNGEDKGRIWCATEWQVAELTKRMGPSVDFAFALIHHPGNWFTGHEDRHPHDF